ncbi:protein FAR1-RELATED SEQUENCE 5-like [Arachis ipaensis]|uniref:protein FAR1-RELATED SEQUENCE 5-like n=1 Tax=Arachis ipaensis TaxID=130454 RepID=UPI0007AF787F|nr:protein FAR1-RELATED SEQUENCE 5-like [Arachis ipaensis]XP_025627948.1 protein FAR1-RELATED SEQUENCE 5-like [Arachis hypogaea]
MASNDPSICVQGSYDTSDDMSDHSKSTEINVPSLSEDDTQRVDKQAQEFYSNYAKKVGFVNKIRNTNFDKTRKESRIPINQSIHCNREGYQESHVKAASQQSIHYHEYRKLTMHAKCVIEDNDEAGIQPNKIYLALANEVGGSSNLDYSEKDVRNYITGNLHCADENADIKKMLSYFSQMKEINPKFFYVVDVNASNKFRSALWVNTRCWASYEYYGDVVSHKLPFTSFVGVNHHGKSTLLGCGLLENEKIRSFEWVFTQWLKCIETAPQAIITDQCKAMLGAIRSVLPNTHHRWCI